MQLFFKQVYPPPDKYISSTRQIYILHKIIMFSTRPVYPSEKTQFTFLRKISTRFLWTEPYSSQPYMYLKKVSSFRPIRSPFFLLWTSIHVFIFVWISSFSCWVVTQKMVHCVYWLSNNFVAAVQATWRDVPAQPSSQEKWRWKVRSYGGVCCRQPKMGDEEKT